MSNYYNMWDYASDIEKDIRSEFGDRVISRIDQPGRMSWNDAIAKYNSLTPEEREALSQETLRRKGLI